MFEAFQNNGRPWERIQQAKSHCGDAWPYYYQDMSGSDKSCGSEHLSLNLPLKLTPTQTYMTKYDV